ncbi:50S ribosomal protein L31e [Candidatus Woesearchaeota archaeon]|nr:50S ribosomal protein L31e [Candidatus Woesearchaeota archaeon]
MTEEKIFTIGLRKEFLKKPKYRRAKKAVTAVKEFIMQHLKVKEVKIGPHLNLKIWERGKRNPPSKVKVKATVEEGTAYVELPEFKFEKVKPKEEKKEEKTAKEEQKKEQEKELIKELSHEEKLKEKKEHHYEPIETPNAEIKQPEKDIENKSKKGRVVGSTGKKGAKQAKP